MVNKNGRGRYKSWNQRHHDVVNGGAAAEAPFPKWSDMASKLVRCGLSGEGSIIYQSKQLGTYITPRRAPRTGTAFPASHRCTAAKLQVASFWSTRLRVSRRLL